MQIVSDSVQFRPDSGHGVEQAKFKTISPTRWPQKPFLTSASLERTTLKGLQLDVVNPIVWTRLPCQSKQAPDERAHAHRTQCASQSKSSRRLIRATRRVCSQCARAMQTTGGARSPLRECATRKTSAKGSPGPSRHPRYTTVRLLTPLLVLLSFRSGSLRLVPKHVCGQTLPRLCANSLA